MDSFSQYSDPVNSSFVSSHSDNEDVLLASSQPKKRAGRKKFNETRHPVYRGVRQRNSNRWICEVREPKKTTRIWLGTFPTAEMAARAHDVAVIALRGPSACLNFADSAWRLPVPASNDAKDIRRAAVEAAEAFRPREEEQTIMDFAGVSSANDEGMMGNYMDEEAIFGMPGLIVNMAQGMLLPPPSYLCGSGSGWDDMDDDANTDISLWSY